MRIPVITTDDRGTFVDIDDILFISANRNKITIHTKDRVYRPVHSLSDYAKLLPFVQLERSNLVNMSKVNSYNPTERLVYFHSNNHDSKSCLVSSYNTHKLKGVNKHWEYPNR